ncbi:hypothetical protein COT98_01540 [Candidatus Falkowbacteria bacterium CG10_big_fil_rev_8_21_14_0_10_39_9]|uniref:Uncharacterized protein n=1 Tax=Candidatus Falkowbacteria bacterium CG10_big_fil_rev_8_21_14_0_10_39_9 TaxID=1974566 RepID=A0A2M6WQ99_9BACT|nr:MAG: hypothetical protein COT98_01540 [Candidatus Falkowbacteria bacterium CG10_big_fil_rev_8_21_14_0_10_39_9]
MRLKVLIREIALFFLGPRWVDLDAKPYAISNMAVKEHRRDGFYRFRNKKVSLFISEKQKGGGVGGPELMQELADKPVLNANLLDHLLDHSRFIPNTWKGKYIYFWGTIYESPNGVLWVRYLYWEYGKWFCSWQPFTQDFYAVNEILIAA